MTTILVVIIIAVLLAVSAVFLYKAGVFDFFKGAEPYGDVGDDISDQIKNPTENIPDTNPYQEGSNPFDESKVNPYDDVYENPFE
jgi:hypothetical protein